MLKSWIGDVVPLDAGAHLKRFVLIALVLACPGRASAQEPGGASGREQALADVDGSLVPSAGASHERFLEHLAGSRARARQALIDRYDEHLREVPDDFRTAIERCKFINQSIAEWDDDEYEYESEEPAESEEKAVEEDCGKALEARYRHEPAVVLYRLSTQWGQAAIDYAQRKLDDESISWTAQDRAQALGTMAERHAALGNQEQAHDLAQRAQALDPSYDGSYLIAEHLTAKNQTQRARRLLVSSLGREQDAPELLRKARLLLDLDAPAAALEAIRRATERGGHVYPLLHAQALERAGDTRAARKVYEGLTEAWNKQSVRTRLFYLDLDRSDAAEAAASYRSLRELGWNADPFGRHRLALTLRHPLSPWRPEDVLGFIGFGVLLLASAVFPVTFIAPLHYIGLWRRSRGAPVVESRWKLRHVWLAAGLLLGLDILVTYAVGYPALAAMWDQSVEVNHSRLDLARLGLLSVLGMGVAAAVMTRRRDWEGLAPRRWLRRSVLRPALLCLLVVLVVGFFNQLLARGLESAGGNGAGLILTRIAALEAIREVYGFPVALLALVVVAPLAEEFLFRGVALEGFARHVPPGIANVLQAVLFVLCHEVRTAPTILTLAILAGWLRRRTGSLASGIALHAMMNALASLRFL